MQPTIAIRRDVALDRPVRIERLAGAGPRTGRRTSGRTTTARRSGAARRPCRRGTSAASRPATAAIWCAFSASTTTSCGPRSARSSAASTPAATVLRAVRFDQRQSVRPDRCQRCRLVPARSPSRRRRRDAPPAARRSPRRRRCTRARRPNFRVRARVDGLDLADVRRCSTHAIAPPNSRPTPWPPCSIPQPPARLSSPSPARRSTTPRCGRRRPPGRTAAAGRPRTGRPHRDRAPERAGDGAGAARRDVRRLRGAAEPEVPRGRVPLLPRRPATPPRW